MIMDNEFNAPRCPEGFVLLSDIRKWLDLGEFGREIDNPTDNLYRSIHEAADSLVSEDLKKLLEWTHDNLEWYDQARSLKYLDDCDNDLKMMLQRIQYNYFEENLSLHRDEINRNITYTALQDWHFIWCISEEAEVELQDLDFMNNDSTLEEEALEKLLNLMEWHFEKKYGEHFAEQAMNRICHSLDRKRLNFDCVNPVAMSADACRQVAEKGYKAAFAECWEDLLN